MFQKKRPTVLPIVAVACTTVAIFYAFFNSERSCQQPRDFSSHTSTAFLQTDRRNRSTDFDNAEETENVINEVVESGIVMNALASGKSGLAKSRSKRASKGHGPASPFVLKRKKPAWESFNEALRKVSGDGLSGSSLTTTRTKRLKTSVSEEENGTSEEEDGTAVPALAALNSASSSIRSPSHLPAAAASSASSSEALVPSPKAVTTIHAHRDKTKIARQLAEDVGGVITGSNAVVHWALYLIDIKDELSATALTLLESLPVSNDVDLVFFDPRASALQYLRAQGYMWVDGDHMKAIEPEKDGLKVDEVKNTKHPNNGNFPNIDIIDGARTAGSPSMPLWDWLLENCATHEFRNVIPPHLLLPHYRGKLSETFGAKWVNLRIKIELLEAMEVRVQEIAREATENAESPERVPETDFVFESPAKRGPV